MFCSPRALAIARTWGTTLLANQLVFVVASEDRKDEHKHQQCAWGKATTVNSYAGGRFELEIFTNEGEQTTENEITVLTATKCPIGIEYVSCVTNEVLFFLGSRGSPDFLLDSADGEVVPGPRYSWMGILEDDVWVFTDTLMNTLKALPRWAHDQPTWMPPAGCAGGGEFCSSFHDTMCKSINGSAAGPFSKNGTKLAERTQHIASGLFMVNQAAFGEMRESLENDALSAVSWYGSRFIDMAVDVFVNSFGFHELTKPWCMGTGYGLGCESFGENKWEAPNVTIEDVDLCIASTQTLLEGQTDTRRLFIHALKWDFMFDMLQARMSVASDINTSFTTAAVLLDEGYTTKATDDVYWKPGKWFPLRYVNISAALSTGLIANCVCGKGYLATDM
jgi:hypothetical protein